MGLELLESDLKPPVTRDTMGPDGNRTEKVVSRDDLDFWHTVTVDIRENTQVAVSILNDLLNYDKLETGTMNLEVERVPVWDLIISTVNQFRIQAVNRHINMNVTIEPPRLGIDDSHDVEGGRGSAAAASERVNVLGDDVRLSQVIRNLISNALKFTPADGTINVSVMHIPDGLPGAKLLPDVETDSAGGGGKAGGDNNAKKGGRGEDSCSPQRAGSIRISVKDTGVGMTKDQLALLFGEGIQFDANRLQHGGGSGLGLSIAKVRKSNFSKHRDGVHVRRKACSNTVSNKLSFVVAIFLSLRALWNNTKASSGLNRKVTATERRSSSNCLCTISRLPKV